MKITCQACQAKYTIADDKVVGKIVKIRCKKCGATIVVNGTEGSASGGGQPPTTSAFDYAAQAGAPSPWTVNVADGDQRTMTDDEIVAAYRAGVVTNETLCWKEGQANWLPILEVAALHAACTAAQGSLSGETGKEPGAASTLGARTPAPDRAAAKEGNGAAIEAAPAAAMSRRPGGRATAADLFGTVTAAGGEDEVLTSAPARTSPMKGGVSQQPSMTATNEASGLIDIRQLGAQMRSGSEEKKKSRIDDIMNLGGGGAFSPSLAAPVLSAPSLDHYSQPAPALLSSPAAAQAKSKALIFLALGAGTFFLVAAVGLAVVLVRGKGLSSEESDKTQTAASAAATTSASATPVPTEQPSASAKAAAEPSSAPPSSIPAPPPAVVKEAPAQPPKEYKAAAPKEGSAAASGAEFNLGEARSRLAAIVGGLQTCKRADTTGSGRVEIVFAPSGGVQSAVLMPGSPFEGTPTGKCVEARFRQARIPPFGGSPMPVTKSFSIN